MLSLSKIVVILHPNVKWVSIDMQNIKATCMDVANMDEILIPIDVET